MAKPVQLRERAAADVDEALDHYLATAATGVAVGFISALERTMASISRNPRIGSSRFSYELDIPELRARHLGRFPYVAFYVEYDSHIDVWRILHGRRDIPAALSENPEQ